MQIIIKTLNNQELMVIKVNQSTSGWSRTSAFMRAIAVMLRYQSVLGQYELLVEKIPALFSKITGLAEGIQLIIGTHDVYVFFLKVFVIAGCLAIVYQFVVGVKACEDQGVLILSCSVFQQWVVALITSNDQSLRTPTSSPTLSWRLA